MKTTAHTPGQWSAATCEGQEVVTVALESGRVVQIAEGVKSVPVAQVRANMALMAAAPAMLEVLNELFAIGDVYHSTIDAKDFNTDFETWATKAKAAIAKATGTTKKPKGQK